ncbi:recombinase family protein, partial [Mycolicibacterium holsaticum]|uniref:recombinase family protein n=1 Tax=Mycolicibacterium holsaticum TaxID=152142 RepID=UPI000B039DCF
MTISADNPDVRNVGTEAELYYDPYNIDLNMNPYPVFARLREEAPLYYNDKHDFYALSRFEDVNKAVIDNEQLRQVLGLLAAGQGDGLVVAKMDRLARSVGHADEILQAAQ